MARFLVTIVLDGYDKSMAEHHRVLVMEVTAADERAASRLPEVDQMFERLVEGMLFPCVVYRQAEIRVKAVLS